MKSKNTFKPQDFKVELVDSKPEVPTWVVTSIEGSQSDDTNDALKSVCAILGFIALVYGLFYFIGG